MHFIITSLTPSIFFAPFCRQKGLDATLGEKFRQNTSCTPSILCTILSSEWGRFGAS